MFHSILYFGLTLATIVVPSIWHEQRSRKDQPCNRNNDAQAGLVGAMIQSVSNAFITAVVFRLSALLLSATGPPLRYSLAILMANVCFFELFFFFGCEICTLNRMHDAARNHESYFRWTRFQGKFQFAVSLLDMHPVHALCTGAFPLLATALVTGSGWLTNMVLVAHLAFRQYTRHSRLQQRYHIKA